MFDNDLVTPKKMAERGWNVVQLRDYDKLPEEVAKKVREKANKPKNEKETYELWLRFERLAHHYAIRLGTMYNYDEVDDIVQQAYLFFHDLVQTYKPLYTRKMLPSDYQQDPKKHRRIYTYKPDTAWKIYEIEPYVSLKMYQRIRHYVQRINVVQSRNEYFGDDSGSSESRTKDFETEIFHRSEVEGELEKFHEDYDTENVGTKVSDVMRKHVVDDTEHIDSEHDRTLFETKLRKILHKHITNKLDKTSPKYFAGKLSLIYGFEDWETARLIGKSKSMIHSYVGSIKEDIRNTPDLIEIIDLFHRNGLTSFDLLG